MRIEIVFFIIASNKDVLFNRLCKFNKLTELQCSISDCEKDEEGGIYKSAIDGQFDNIDDLKKTMEKLKKFKWFAWWDMDVIDIDSGKYLFAEGKWQNCS